MSKFFSYFMVCFYMENALLDGSSGILLFFLQLSCWLASTLPV